MASRRGGRAMKLTAREIEVLRLITAGRSARVIAATLGMSVRTASNHTLHIYEKIGEFHNVFLHLLKLIV